MIHQLKCRSEYFQDLISGTKTFEIRKDDRGFCVGDYLAINELTNQPKKGQKECTETGRSAVFYVNYICNDTEYCKEGFVVLGIEACGVAILGVGCEPDILEAGESYERI